LGKRKLSGEKATLVVTFANQGASSVSPLQVVEEAKKLGQEEDDEEKAVAFFIR